MNPSPISQLAEKRLGVRTCGHDTIRIDLRQQLERYLALGVPFPASGGGFGQGFDYGVLGYALKLRPERYPTLGELGTEVSA